MSIPIDRLYNYLDSLCNHDVLIYRFFPHGSKNLDDCKPIKNTLTRYKKFGELLKLQVLVCHDQEPLAFDQLYREFKINCPDNIPRNPFRGLLAEYDYCNVYDKVILCHSELNSKEVEKFKQHGCIDVYYWSHALISRDWFRYAEHDSTLLKKNQVQKQFLIYNRAWSNSREYRLKFSELLVQHNLINQCLTKFNPVDQGMHYRDYEFKNPSFQVANYGLENYFQLNHSHSASSADFDIDDYASTEIEVVLETLFDDTRNHLTEKSLRPIACGQPFILVSTPGSLEYLKNYGFETFSDVFDESYDKELDPLSRLEKIIKLMKNMKNLTDSEKTQLYDIALRNKQRFFSAEFQQVVVDEFTKNLDSAMVEMKNHCLGSFLKHHKQYLPTPWTPTLLMRFKDKQDYQQLMEYVESMQIKV
jgi:hypothetical protein